MGKKGEKRQKGGKRQKGETKEKRKRGEANEWTTKEQLSWLEKRVDEFQAARRKRKYKSEFQPKLFNDWFIRFPEPDAPGPNASKVERDLYKAKVVERQDQLHNWFYNHTRNKPIQESDIMALFSAQEDPKKPKKRTARKKTHEQIFSKTFYKTEIKPEVDAELARMRADSADGKLPKGASLPIVKRVTHEKYMAATEEVKGQVAQLAEELEPEEVKEEEESPTDDESRKQFIARLNEICPRIVEALHTATGWPVLSWSNYVSDQMT